MTPDSSLLVLVHDNDIASREALEGLALCRLAEHLAMRKSGRTAHFGNLKGLQPAAIEDEADVIIRELAPPY